MEINSTLKSSTDDACTLLDKKTSKLPFVFKKQEVQKKLLLGCSTIL
jgi:hypothetical protein